MTNKIYYEPDDMLEDYIGRPETFGSARYLQKEEAEQIGITTEGNGKNFCPYIGVISSVDHNDGCAFKKIKDSINVYARSPSPIQYNGEMQPGVGNLITFGPTRSGKGTGQIIMNLLTWEGAVFVLDVKGENYLHSAGYRNKKMEQNIFRFAPFEEHSHIWNPLMSIRVPTDWVDSTWAERCQEEEDTRYLANLIIASSGSQNDQFWEDKAKMLLVGLLLYTRTEKLSDDKKDHDKEHLVRERSMREVTRLITLPPDCFLSLLEDMIKSDRTLVKMTGSSFKGFMSGDSKLGQSIRATLIKHIDVWSYERVHKATYKSSTESSDGEPALNEFNFSEMRDGKISFYLIIPPEYLSEYRSVLRVMIGCAIRELKDSYKKSKLNDDNPPVLFLLDEFAQLAHMSPIEEGLAYLTGYGVRLWFFLQDINQLKANYPKSWESFLANTEFKCFFGVNDVNTAKLVSEMAGTATVDNRSNTNGSHTSAATWNNNNQSTNFSITQAYTARRLITPDEVLHMQSNKQIVFFKSLYPMFLDLPKYYEIEGFQERSQIEPPQKINFL